MSLAKRISEPANLVSMWKSSRDIPERIISNVALETGYLKEWLKTGNGPMRTITADVVNHDATNRIREGPWLPPEQREILDLWETADETARRHAKMILEDSVRQRMEPEARQNHEGNK